MDGVVHDVAAEALTAQQLEERRLAAVELMRRVRQHPLRQLNMTLGL
jgi:hypothetical protein